MGEEGIELGLGQKASEYYVGPTLRANAGGSFSRYHVMKKVTSGSMAVACRNSASGSSAS